MIDNLENLFGMYREAVVAVKNGKIVFRNSAAKELLPDVEKPEDCFPEQILDYEAENFVSTVTINGRQAYVSVSKFEEYRIYSIIPAKVNEDNDVGPLLLSVTNEMKDMLSVMKMATGLLFPDIENMGNEHMTHYTSIINHCYYSIQRLTDNLTQLSEIAGGNSELKRSTFDVVKLCRDLVESVNFLVAERGVTISSESTEDSIIVNADKNMISQMLLHLLSNSLTYTPAGGAIRISAANAGNRLVLTVSDNGSGISADILPTVWNRYAVLKNTGEPDKGAGLGLPIVQHIANKHGGSAVLESRQGAGTQVTISLPVIESGNNDFRDSVTDYESAGMQQLLTELSEVVSYEKYSQLYMD